MSRFTIALSGLDESDAAVFTAALDAVPGDIWERVDQAPCRLLVVDIDTVWGHMDWLRATANGQQVVTYTRDAQVRGCDLVLHKPLRVDELTTLLQTLVDADGEHVAPTTEAVPEPTIEATPEREPEPTREPLPASMTLGECLLADRIAGPVATKSDDHLELALDPERGGYTGPSALKPLKPLLDTPMSQIAPLAPDAVERMREAPAQPLTRLLWFAALSNTPGELSASLDPQARYRLARWPQIEREFPRHFRIATAMMKDAGTLGDIASAANAPVGDVADFINAYSVAGYVTSESDRNDGDDSRNGMFSRLRNPFSRGAQEPA